MYFNASSSLLYTNSTQLFLFFCCCTHHLRFLEDLTAVTCQKTTACNTQTTCVTVFCITLLTTFWYWSINAVLLLCTPTPHTAIPSKPTAIACPQYEVIGCYWLPLTASAVHHSQYPLSHHHPALIFQLHDPITVNNLTQVEVAHYSTSPVLAELGCSIMTRCWSTPTTQVIDDLQQSTLLWVQNAQNLHFSLSGWENCELLNYF